MSNHTPEPWRVGRPGTVVSDTPVPGMGGSDAVEYYGGHLIGESIIEANARRIVACVNACRGLSTGELEQHGLVSAVGTELAALEDQRDELLLDMQDVLDMLINELHADTAANQAEDMLRLSIGTAKYRVKGGAENHSPGVGNMVPDGWQLVPVEPTIEMVQAATNSAVGFGTRAAYQAMLSAAPKPEGGEA